AGVAAAADPPADPARAADPLGAMLADAKAAYGKLRDYTATFTRQERVGGVLGAEQVAELKVRVSPYSVRVRFARPEAAAGVEGVYVAGSRTGKAKVRAKGAAGFTSAAADDPKPLGGRHPLPDIGVGPVIDRLAGIAARERTLGNPVEVFTSEFTFAGKATTRYEVFCRRPHAHRYAHRVLVYVDNQTKLPVRFEAYDTPKSGQAVGELLEAHSYTDLKANVGLGDAAFGE
ncbi:MAG: DUF1571 domain-containing protein, partial [Gemmataceae bacterium]|nr:DUF1571 domain-containing protein [Gemmataceae bacterium]